MKHKPGAPKEKSTSNDSPGDFSSSGEFIGVLNRCPWVTSSIRKRSPGEFYCIHLVTCIFFRTPRGGWDTGYSEMLSLSATCGGGHF